MAATSPPPLSLDAIVALGQAHGVAPAHVRACASLWTLEVLESGRAWRRRGQRAQSLAWVVDGEIGSWHAKLAIERLERGELLGMPGCITRDGTHKSDLVATRRSVLATLTSEALLELRSQRDPLYTDLLALELRGVIGRLRRVEARIAAISLGTFATPTRAPASAIGRLWRSFRRRPESDTIPALEPLVRGLPGLAAAPQRVVEELSAGFTSRVVQAKELVTVEGDDEPGLSLLASGQVDVLCIAGKGDGSLLLGRLDQGALFGMPSLIAREPHMRTVVAVTSACIYQLPAARYDQLSPDTRRVLDECLVLVLAAQLRRATRSLVASTNVFHSAAADPHGAPDKSLVLFMTAQNQLAGAHRADDDPDE